jgi:hypothetical protein
MPAVVYVLCALTSLLCSILLLRAYRATKTRLLLWSGLAFFFFALNGAALFIDLILFPTIDLSFVRRALTTSGLALLLWGLVWEAGT